MSNHGSTSFAEAYHNNPATFLILHLQKMEIIYKLHYCKDQLYFKSDVIVAIACFDSALEEIGLPKLECILNTQNHCIHGGQLIQPPWSALGL